MSHPHHALSGAALVPLVVVAVSFAAFCLIDVARRENPKYLPKWVWALIICLSIPLGGIVYLVFGRSD